MDIKRVEDCFGHVSFERPEALRPVYQFNPGDGDATLYFGRDANFKQVEVTVVAVGVDQSRFRATIEARDAEIAASVHDDAGRSMLIDREGDEAGDRILLRSYARKNVVEAHTLELHKLVGGVHVALQATSYGEDDLQAVRSRLETVATSLWVNEPRKSSQKGLCLGSLRVSAGQDYEAARMQYQGVGPTFGDVQLELEMDSLPAGKSLGLVERGEANLAGLEIRPRVLRKGQRDLAGGKGDEWLGVFEAEGHPLHSFFAETSTASLQQGASRLQVTLHAGEAKNDVDIIPSPLEDGQAMQLWDALISSFRAN